MGIKRNGPTATMRVAAGVRLVDGISRHVDHDAERGERRRTRRGCSALFVLLGCRNDSRALIEESKKYEGNSDDEEPGVNREGLQQWPRATTTRRGREGAARQCGDEEFGEGVF